MHRGGGIGVSSTMRFGDIAAAPKLGDMAVEVKFGEEAVEAVEVELGDVDAEVKFGDAAAGAKFGDTQTGSDVGAKFGEAGPALEKFGDRETGAEVRSNGLFDITGRKLGDVAKESVRFACAVAKRAWKSGDEEPVTDLVVVSTEVLGHTASPPSSTWS